MTAPRPKLISFNLCPYVQRSVITLLEKDVPYDVEYIDLSAKPDWFLKISPFGKVPVLLVGDTVLFESAVINEYLEETTGGGMHPEDALGRAHNRAWIELASALGGDSYGIMAGKTEEDVQKSLARTRDKLGKLAVQVKGPYFGGEAFRLVDAAFAPMMQRLVWSEQIAPELDIFAGQPKVRAYADALLARDSVRRSTVPDIEAIFREYLKGRGSPTRDVEPSWLGRKLNG